MNQSEPANYYFNNNLAAASEKTEEGANPKGEAIEIINLVRDINYKTTKEQAKKPVTIKGRYDEPQSLIEALENPLSKQWLKTISDELT